MSDQTIRFESVSSSRISVTVNDFETVISAPPRKPYFGIIFLGVWLCGWTAGGWGAISQLFDLTGEVKLFLVFWLCGWAAGWIFAVKGLFWCLFGSEKVFATRGSFSHVTNHWFIERTKNYMPAMIQNFRRIDGTANYIRAENSGPMSSLSFEYGPKTISLFHGVDEGEAAVIKSALQRQYGWIDIK
jgi:hypothetical protein